MSQVLTAGDNGLAAMNGLITFNGTPEKARGAIDLTAQKSRMGTIALPARREWLASVASVIRSTRARRITTGSFAFCFPRAN